MPCLKFTTLYTKVLLDSLLVVGIRLAALFVVNFRHPKLPEFLFPLVAFSPFFCHSPRISSERTVCRITHTAPEWCTRCLTNTALNSSSSRQKFTTNTVPKLTSLCSPTIGTSPDLPASSSAISSCTSSSFLRLHQPPEHRSSALTSLLNTASLFYLEAQVLRSACFFRFDQPPEHHFLRLDQPPEHRFLVFSWRTASVIRLLPYLLHALICVQMTMPTILPSAGWRSPQNFCAAPRLGTRWFFAFFFVTPVAFESVFLLFLLRCKNWISQHFLLVVTHSVSC